MIFFGRIPPWPAEVIFTPVMFSPVIFMLITLTLATPNTAMAAGWTDLWLTPDQQAQRMAEDGQWAEAQHGPIQKEAPQWFAIGPVAPNVVQRFFYIAQHQDRRDEQDGDAKHGERARVFYECREILNDLSGTLGQ